MNSAKRRDTITARILAALAGPPRGDQPSEVRVYDATG